MPRKSQSQSESPAVETPKARRRSHSQFTSVADAMVMRDKRPYSIGTTQHKDGSLTYWIADRSTGKRIKGSPTLNSHSSARRALYKAEAAAGAKFTARSIAAAHKAKEKAAAKKSA